MTDTTLPLRLSIVDDEQLIVTLLEQYFNNQPETEVVLTAHSGEEFIERLPDLADQIDIALLDLRLKSMDGAEIAQHIQDNYPKIQTVVVSSYYKKTFMGYLLKTGVSAFLPKGILPQELLRILLQVHQQGYYFLPEQVDIMRQQITPKAPKPKLSPLANITAREKEVLELLCQQKTAQEIADLIFVTKRTVEGHKNNLLSKTGMKNTAGLIIYAIKEGIVDLGSLRLN